MYTLASSTGPGLEAKYTLALFMSHGHCKLKATTTIIITVHEKHNSSVNNYYSACMKNKTTVKDNESLYLWIYNYTARTKRFFKWRYFNTKMIYHELHAYACVTLYCRSQGGDKGSIIIVITEAAIFKLEVLSASSSEVCLLCFAVYSFRVFSFT